MRDALLNNYQSYARCFPSYGFNLERCKRVICSGIEAVAESLKLAPPEETIQIKWFCSPECSQIAADTFGVPIAVYPVGRDEDNSSIYFPVFDRQVYKPKPESIPLPPVPNPGPKPLPLVLINNFNMHWFTLKMKRSIKVTWPRVNVVHSSAMRRAGYDDDRIKSFWNLFLTFAKDEDQNQTVDAPTEEQNHSPLGNQLPEVTTSLERQDNNPTVLDDSQSLEGIERSIALCDKRLTEYIIQIAKINETDPALAKELREKQDIQMKDRRTFAALRASMIKGRDSSSWLSNKVPPAMPKLQWTTHSYDKSSEVFMDVGDAPRKFKDILIMHGLSPDYHWRRLVTGSLSSEHRAWLDELPSKPMTWNTFCEKYREAFGNDQEDEQQQAADELLEIQMGESEGLDQYIDRFMTLKRKAADLDSLILTGRFVKGLIPALGRTVGMAISGWSRSRRSSLNRVIRITKRMKVNLPRGHTALGQNRRPESPSASNGRANMWQRYANDNARINHGPGNNNGCPFHEGENLADRNNDPTSCPEYNKANKAFAKLNINKSGSGTKINHKPRFTGKQLELFKEGLCVHCEKNRSPAVILVLVVKSINSTMVTKGNINKRIDDLLLESNLPLTNRSLSTIVPVTIEGYRTFALIDNAANFSSINPRIIKYLNKDNIVKKSSTIRLAQTGAEVTNNHGMINNVEILYNGIKLKHNFELFDFNADTNVNVCFGADILPLVNICITGLATSREPYQPIP
ncbi:unnamed protein product [Mucor hiemalis]